MTTEIARPATAATGGEQSRAAYPDHEGYVERDGVRVFYEVYGDGEPTVLFMPPSSLVHSRAWKAQIPYFARHFRAIAFDPRGNGRSDRPATVAAYATEEFAEDALQVLDATGTDRAFLATMSLGAQFGLQLATAHPERVRGLAFIAPLAPSGRPSRHALPLALFKVPLPVHPGLTKYTRPYMLGHFAELVDWLAKENFPERHSTKPIEDATAWAFETDAETFARSAEAVMKWSGVREQRKLVRSLDRPVLVIHGGRDTLTPPHDGRALAARSGGRFVLLPEAGHAVQARHPVEVNLALREFVEGERPAPAPKARRSGGGKRALFVSSPIGLGHAQRDLAIARQLRELEPGLQVDWLAQDPVTRLLEGEGERIHPASVHLASESGHFESESSEHDLHCFQAFRRMDEILIANFMLFHDVVTEDSYDLWIGDEAWEVDYYLHENPNLKRAPYAWLTDFVGFVPLPDGGEREEYLAGDYNQQIDDHLSEHPGLRDRSIFVGNDEDVVTNPMAPGLPPMREWARGHYEYAGYVTGFAPISAGDRQALREELGYREDEKVCIVTVGGSGVGASLLARVIASFDDAKRLVPELRMIAVCGPRIDPDSIPQPDGLEVRPYVHNLYRHLAACDIAVVQGGLTTAMELTANRRPFLYFPLKHHFEQEVHVRHRLERYRAGRAMDYDASPPELIAQAIAEEVGREVDYMPVETDGARRAAERIAEML